MEMREALQEKEDAKGMKVSLHFTEHTKHWTVKLNIKVDFCFNMLNYGE